MLNEIVVAFASFTGLFVGSFIASQTKEELKTGEKYFVLLEKVVIIAIISLLMHLYAFSIWPRVIIYVLAIVVLFLIRPPSITTYSLLGIALYLSSREATMFYWVASLIFLYGLAAGSLLFIAHKKFRPVTIFVAHISFLIIAVMLFYWKPF